MSGMCVFWGIRVWFCYAGKLFPGELLLYGCGVCGRDGRWRWSGSLSDASERRHTAPPCVFAGRLPCASLSRPPHPPLPLSTH